MKTCVICKVVAEDATFLIGTPKDICSDQNSCWKRAGIILKEDFGSRQAAVACERCGRALIRVVGGKIVDAEREAHPRCPDAAECAAVAARKKAAEAPFDPVNRPAHYADRKIEVIDFIEDSGWAEGFCLGNAVKYISRAGKKDPAKKLEDLEKARWYLDRFIKHSYIRKRLGLS